MTQPKKDTAATEAEPVAAEDPLAALKRWKVAAPEIKAAILKLLEGHDISQADTRVGNFVEHIASDIESRALAAV
jgi:hypothetical protein